MKTYQDKDIVQNHNFTKLNELEIYALINYILSHDINMKEVLNIKDNNTYGIEIEFDNIRNKKIIKDEFKKQEIKYVNILSPYNRLNDNNDKWIYTDEFTLKKGYEINSPILKNTKEEWLKIIDICNLLNEHAQITNNCAGHIHIGSQVLGDNPKAWLNFLKIWSVYENIIYRFSYGEYSKPRTLCKTFSKPISSEAYCLYYELKKSTNIEEIISSVNNVFNKYDKAFNLENVKTKNINTPANKNTIEIRCPNGTLNPIIWQNNIYFFIKLLEYCNSTKYNDDIIERRIRKEDLCSYDLSNYNDIHFSQALELSNMIYNSDKDKICFLKQYVNKTKKF